MISINPENIFVVFTLFMLMIVAGLWSYEIWRDSNASAVLSRERLCRCKDCLLTFIVYRSETVARCPRCNSLNQINKKNRT